ncbi:hypothetical protein F01_210100 [Burkholderia cenocepacia]|nr:hypothetical protein F01_210100 [Burkholderia cenocepacia]
MACVRRLLGRPGRVPVRLRRRDRADPPRAAPPADQAARSACHALTPTHAAGAAAPRSTTAFPACRPRAKRAWRSGAAPSVGAPRHPRAI